jgi:transcription termination/antitermination protein NusG
MSDEEKTLKKGVEDAGQKKEVTEFPKLDNPNARWYVVHTYSGHENKVSATLKKRITSMGLENKIFEILVPTQEKIEVREGKKVTVHDKIFPGYILVRMELNDESWHAVRSTAGVTSFVGTTTRPTPLPDEEVETILKFTTMEAPKYKASFTVGEAVKIIDGPFSDFLGTVDEIDEEKGKLKALISIFGRETPVELDFLQVNKI